MENAKFLYDTFNTYYREGISELDKGNLISAKRNLLLAVQSLLKLAKISSGNLKITRINRANEINKLITSIDRKIEEERRAKANNNSYDFDDEETINSSFDNYDESVSLNDALNELNNLIGLSSVKNEINSLVKLIKVNQERENNGYNNQPISLHMVFSGNPGTGKTTVARIVGKILRALGVLSKGQLIEVDRSSLVAGYIGQTALKTKSKIKEALGGVLFIDEAYMLAQKDVSNDFGIEAIDTLNKAMEDNRSDFVVIAAGYKDKMEDFINSNPGLPSRFNTYINFEDYTPLELFQIFELTCKKYEYSLDEEAKSTIISYFQSKNFPGNGRDVRNLFEKIMRQHSIRVGSLVNPSKIELGLIKSEDIYKAIND